MGVFFLYDGGILCDLTHSYSWVYLMHLLHSLHVSLFPPHNKPLLTMNQLSYQFASKTVLFKATVKSPFLCQPFTLNSLLSRWKWHEHHTLSYGRLLVNWLWFRLDFVFVDIKHLVKRFYCSNKSWYGSVNCFIIYLSYWLGF
mgnify:FL=1